MTPTPTEIESLLERVRSATGPDGELDAAIACLFIFPDLRPARPDDFDGKFGYSPGNLKVEHGFLQADHFTASIDAAVALIERVLPGFAIRVTTADPSMSVPNPAAWAAAELLPHLYNDAAWKVGPQYTTAPTAQLAIIAAGLTALLHPSMETTNG